MSRVLIISSENNTLEVVKSNLEREGYTVLTSKSGLDGIKMALVKSPDLIILDTMLSDIDVYKVCQELSNNPLTSLNPVIVLSASNKVEDKVLFLEKCADDYITKPFGIKEFIARVNSFLHKINNKTTQRALSVRTTYKHKNNRRLKKLESEKDGFSSKIRSSEPSRKQIKIKDIILDLEKLCVKVNDNITYLSSKEFKLLKLLMSNPGRVFSRKQLMNAIWNIEFENDTRTIDVHIRHLRQKIEPNPAKPKYIVTVRGVGYKFNI